MPMHLHCPRRALLLALTALLIALAGCAPTPDAPEHPPAIDTAEQALADGDTDAAVAAFLEAAEQRDAPLQTDYTLRAAEALARAGRPDEAQELVARTAVDDDTPASIIDYRVAVQARIDLARDDDERALARVDERLPSDTGRAADLLEVRADALARLGRPVASARTRASLEEVLPEGPRLDDSRERLREALTGAPLDALREAMPPAPDTFGGWLELVFLVREYQLDPDRMESAVAAWRDRYPEHPAAGDVAEALMATYRAATLRPERIALLLPLSGDLADAGRAVRNGFVAARMWSGEDAPIVRVHDIGEAGDDPWAAYMEAVQSGADLVVGPLTRAAVSVFGNTGTLPVPMLALNRPGDDDTLPGNLFRFGLLPEHEARAAARHALANGQQTAVVLIPSSSWGERVGGAFREAFEQGGGTVLALERYRESESDFSLPIRRMLALEDSSSREARLRRTINRSVEFEPRRRRDVDVVFMGAFPRQARLIRPQLRFHRALDLPVMATSHAWGGRDDVAADRDMAGVVFFDMPWVLGRGDRLDPPRSALGAVWDDVDRRADLYALGVDAYRLVPHLASLRVNPETSLEGATGRLRIDASGAVHRDVLPARFYRGRVERLDTDRTDPLPDMEAADGGDGQRRAP